MQSKTPRLALLPFASASRMKGNGGIGRRFRSASQSTGTVLGNVAVELKESKVSREQVPLQVKPL